MPAKWRSFRAALATETTGTNIFRTRMPPRRHQGLTPIDTASGFDRQETTSFQARVAQPTKHLQRNWRVTADLRTSQERKHLFNPVSLERCHKALRIPVDDAFIHANLPSSRREEFEMSKFWYVTGELTEVQRYINVPMRWCEQYPARERREVWLARTDGIDQEVKLVVHSRSIPLLRRCFDVLAAVGIFVSGAIVAASWDVRSLLLTVPFGLLYLPSRVLGRLLWRTRLQRQVDRGLDMALTAASAEPPRLWRVK